MSYDIVVSYASLVMYPNLFSTVCFASERSCLTSTGPTSLYTTASPSNRSSSCVREREIVTASCYVRLPLSLSCSRWSVYPAACDSLCTFEALGRAILTPNNDHPACTFRSCARHTALTFLKLVKLLNLFLHYFLLSLQQLNSRFIRHNSLRVLNPGIDLPAPG